MEVAQQRTLLRQAAYRLIGALFLYPTSSRLKKIEPGAEWMDAELGDFEVEQVFGDAQGARSLLETIGSLGDDLENLQAEWVHLFGGGRSRCLPYEGAYVSSEEAAAVRVELERMCAQAGLCLSVNDLPDHASVQFEFMSFLCGQQFERFGGNAKDVDARLEYQRSFLRRHLGKWFPEFANCVMSHSGGIYGMVCQVGADLIECDRRYLNDICASSQPEGEGLAFAGAL